MRVIDWTVAPQNHAVNGVSATFATDMAAVANHRDNTAYKFNSTVACWIKQGAAPVATAGTAGELFVAAGVDVYLSPKDGVKLAFIQAAAGGTVTLALTREI